MYAGSRPVTYCLLQRSRAFGSRYGSGFRLVWGRVSVSRTATTRCRKTIAIPDVKIPFGTSRQSSCLRLSRTGEGLDSRVGNERPELGPTDCSPSQHAELLERPC